MSHTKTATLKRQNGNNILSAFDEEKLLHLGQEPLTAGDLLPFMALNLGERDLLHRRALSDVGGINRFPPPEDEKQLRRGFCRAFLKSQPNKIQP